MKTYRFACLLALPLLFCATVSAVYAQMPTDNDTWKLRCNLLHDNVSRLGVAPPWLTSTPQQVAGPRYTTFGWDRDHAAQPAVACVLFYLGAIADHNAPVNHADHIHSIESSTMGLVEWQTLHGQKITDRQKITRVHAKAAEIPKPALTVPEEEAIVAASSTMPLSAPARAR
jgi:hypothetical protein